MDEMYNQTCLGYTEGAEFILGLLSKEIDRRGQVSSVDENPRGVVRDVAVVRRALSEIHKAALRELRESDRYKESGK